MRTIKLALGTTLLAVLLLSACSNQADLGPTTGRAADEWPPAVYGCCYDGPTPVNGITCIILTKQGDEYFKRDVSHYQPAQGNGFYSCEADLQHPAPNPGHTCIAAGMLNGEVWGCSDPFTWNPPYAGWITIIKDHNPQ